MRRLIEMSGNVDGLCSYRFRFETLERNAGIGAPNEIHTKNSFFTQRD